MSDKLELSIVKALVESRIIAIDFSYNHGAHLFSDKFQAFVKLLTSYVRVYREVPTRRTLVDRSASNEKTVAYINSVFDALDAAKYDLREFPYDLDQLKKKYTDKCLLKLKRKIEEEESDGSFHDSKAVVKDIELAINNIRNLNENSTFVQKALSDYMPEFDDDYEAKAQDPDLGRGILTGYSYLDYITDGVHPGEFLIVAGNTGSGKSMMLNNMAIQMWMQKNTISTPDAELTPGKNVLYFSLEMPFKACANRTMARMADVPSIPLRNASLIDEDRNSVALASEFIRRFKYTFEIVDIPRNVTAEQIELRYHDAKTRFEPDVVIVDYLGLMSDEVEAQDWLKLGVISGKLHEFGRANNVVVASAVQLNDSGGKEGKEAGSKKNGIGMHRIGRSRLIMHHANIGIQIEDRPNEDDYPYLEYHIIKNRDGPRGHASLKKKFSHASILDISRGETQNDGDISDKIIKARGGGSSE